MTAQTIIHLSAPTSRRTATYSRPLVNAPPDRPFVIAQLGQSLDGRIATPTGDSRWINRDCALDHVHRLRANVDAVVVGVGTVIADDPLLNVRRVPGRHPARVVIDPNGRMDRGARLLAADGVRRFVVCGREPRPARREPSLWSLGAMARYWHPARSSRRCSSLGLKKILIEGGASTVSAFIDAGCRRPAACAGRARDLGLWHDRAVAESHPGPGSKPAARRHTFMCLTTAMCYLIVTCAAVS